MNEVSTEFCSSEWEKRRWSFVVGRSPTRSRNALRVARPDFVWADSRGGGPNMSCCRDDRDRFGRTTNDEPTDW